MGLGYTCTEMQYLSDFLSKNFYFLFFLHIIKDIWPGGMLVLQLCQFLHYNHIRRERLKVRDM